MNLPCAADLQLGGAAAFIAASMEVKVGNIFQKKSPVQEEHQDL